MTAVLEPDDTVIVATAEDLTIAIENALRRAGCTFDELAEQARDGYFDSLRARLAWSAVGDLYRG